MNHFVEVPSEELLISSCADIVVRSHLQLSQPLDIDALDPFTVAVSCQVTYSKTFSFCNGHMTLQCYIILLIAMALVTGVIFLVI